MMKSSNSVPGSKYLRRFSIRKQKHDNSNSAQISTNANKKLFSPGVNISDPIFTDVPLPACEKTKPLNILEGSSNFSSKDSIKSNSQLLPEYSNENSSADFKITESLQQIDRIYKHPLDSGDSLNQSQETFVTDYAKNAHSPNPEVLLYDVSKVNIPPFNPASLDKREDGTSIKSFYKSLMSIGGNYESQRTVYMSQAKEYLNEIISQNASNATGQIPKTALMDTYKVLEYRLELLVTQRQLEHSEKLITELCSTLDIELEINVAQSNELQELQEKNKKLIAEVEELKSQNNAYQLEIDMLKDKISQTENKQNTEMKPDNISTETDPPKTNKSFQKIRADLFNLQQLISSLNNDMKAIEHKNIFEKDYNSSSVSLPSFTNNDISQLEHEASISFDLTTMKQIFSEISSETPAELQNQKISIALRYIYDSLTKTQKSLRQNFPQCNFSNRQVLGESRIYNKRDMFAPSPSVLKTAGKNYLYEDSGRRANSVIYTSKFPQLPPLPKNHNEPQNKNILSSSQQPPLGLSRNITPPLSSLAENEKNKKSAAINFGGLHISIHEKEKKAFSKSRFSIFKSGKPWHYLSDDESENDAGKRKLKQAPPPIPELPEEIPREILSQMDQATLQSGKLNISSPIISSFEETSSYKNFFKKDESSRNLILETTSTSSSMAEFQLCSRVQHAEIFSKSRKSETIYQGSKSLVSKTVSSHVSGALKNGDQENKDPNRGLEPPEVSQNITYFHRPRASPVPDYAHSHRNSTYYTSSNEYENNRQTLKLSNQPSRIQQISEEDIAMAAALGSFVSTPPLYGASHSEDDKSFQASISSSSSADTAIDSNTSTAHQLHYHKKSSSDQYDFLFNFSEVQPISLDSSGKAGKISSARRYSIGAKTSGTPRVVEITSYQEPPVEEEQDKEENERSKNCDESVDKEKLTIQTSILLEDNLSYPSPALPRLDVLTEGSYKNLYPPSPSSFYSEDPSVKSPISPAINVGSLNNVYENEIKKTLVVNI